MTDEHLKLLKSSIDQIVILETLDGERIPARILFVFDGEETPDVFYLKVEPALDRTSSAQGDGGYSVLLSDIAAVHPYVRNEPT